MRRWKWLVPLLLALTLVWGFALQQAVTTLECGASLVRGGSLHTGAVLKQRYLVECYGSDGELKWAETIDNLVVTEGLNKYLDATLKTGLSSPAWYVFLKGSGTVQASDTMSSHPNWNELTPYSNATRPQWNPGTISNGSVDNSGSKAQFNINASSTIYGAGMCDDDTKGGTSGTLLGAGDFSSSRSVESGDTLNVTITCSLTAS